MAFSKAKKHRLKLEREGRRNPEKNRKSWMFNPIERKTKTKKEKMNQILKAEDRMLKKYTKRDFDKSLF